MLAGPVMADAGAGMSQSYPGLQLLLRFLPFRSGNNPNGNNKPVQVQRHKLLEELRRNPLWQFTNTDAQHPTLKTAIKRTAPQEAEQALLEYVRLAAEAEQQHHQGKAHPSRQWSTADVAAELHALYALAAIHVAQQQDRKQMAHAKAKLTDSDFLQLLKAYASLEDNNSSNSNSSSDSHSSITEQKPCKHRLSSKGEDGWDNQAAAAAAAMQALYAFSRLADAAHEQEQQQQQQRGHLLDRAQQQQVSHSPGQLVGGHSSSDAWDSVQQINSTPRKANNASCSSRSSTGSACSTSSDGSKSGDLQTWLKLAQLDMQQTTS